MESQPHITSADPADHDDPIIKAGLEGVRWFEETYGAFTEEELAAADERIRQSNERVAANIEAQQQRKSQ